MPLTTKFNGRSPQEFDDWTVPNFGGSQFGTIDLVDATANSVNTVYAQLNLQIGPEKTAEAATRAGITTPVQSNPANVLGTDAVRPLDIAGSYATIASGGIRVDPFIVRTVLNPDDSVAFERKEPTEEQRAFAPDVIADATFAMTQVVQKGSGEDWIKPLGRPIAGKTGTSNDNKSAWFVGFTPTIVTEVSLNQINGTTQETITPFGRPKQVTGGTWPAFLWQSYMKEVFAQPQYAPVVDFPPRANVGGKPSPSATAPSETVAPTEEPTQEAPSEIAVPSGLEGKLEGDATAAVVNAGLVASIVSEPSDTVTSGRVIRVEPRGGTILAPGGSVTLVVSSGPKPVPTQEPSRRSLRRPLLRLRDGGRAVALRPSLRAHLRPQPISAVAPGRVA